MNCGLLVSLRREPQLSNLGYKVKLYLLCFLKEGIGKYKYIVQGTTVAFGIVNCSDSYSVKYGQWS